MMSCTCGKRVRDQYCLSNNNNNNNNNNNVCLFPVTTDTFLVESNRQDHQLSSLRPSTTYSVALYATKGPLTSGTVITNFQTRKLWGFSALPWQYIQSIHTVGS